MNEKVETLLSQMTLEEKVTILAGENMWNTAPIPRLGIPAMKVSDGPNGARGGGGLVGGTVTAACLPAGISLASTWNTELVTQVGAVLAQEAKTKGASMLLGPTVNIHRSPVNGRNFECFSEDPYLTARMAVAYIKGLQSQGVSATVKHYVCNDSEFERNSISSEVGERALREIYLPPFKAAVQEAGTWGLMSSYNKINGVFASENHRTLTEILKNEWGFEGLVMSDWFGTNSVVEGGKNGLDLEMPGPTRWRGKQLLQAVNDGEVPESAIDDSVRRLLGVMIKTGVFDDPGRASAPEQAVDRPEHRAVARRAAAEGIVLLKNEDSLLPLDPRRVKKLAIIGPNAKTARIMGGGSARVNYHYAVTPFDGILNRVGDLVKVGYELGCTNFRKAPVLNPALLTPARGDGRGLNLEYFNNRDLSGAPVLVTTTEMTEQFWLGGFSPAVDPTSFSARMSGRFRSAETGKHTFSLGSAGQSCLFINGEQVIDNWTNPKPRHGLFDTGAGDVLHEIDLTAGQSVDLVIEYCKPAGSMFAAVRLGCLEPLAADSLQRAAALAQQSDAALVFVGLSEEWESEGFDRPNIDLVGQQVALIEAVAAAQPNTVVVVQTGSPIAMPWLTQVKAVLEAWFPGQECGNAIADVLFGDMNPSGRLPQTFPMRLEDNPACINYPGENGKVVYGEGIFVGYRYYEKKKVTPLFPFGFGLSYTHFVYSNLRLSAAQIDPDDTLLVSVDITNTGARPGQEVVQLYISDLVSRLVHPEKELKAFAKVALQPGETRTVTLELTKDSLSYYDDCDNKWVAAKGEFRVLVGSSSQDIHLATTFILTRTVRSGAPVQPGVIRFNRQSKLQDVLTSQQGREVLEKHFPGVLELPELTMASGFSLEQIAGIAPDLISPKKLMEVVEDLAKI